MSERDRMPPSAPRTAWGWAFLLLVLVALAAAAVGYGQSALVLEAVNLRYCG